MKYKLNDELEKIASLVFNVGADEDYEDLLEDYWDDDEYSEEANDFSQDDEDEEECDEDDKESYEQWLNAFGHIHIVADGSFRTAIFKQPSGREISIKLPCARDVVCDLRGDGIAYTNIRFNQTEADDLSRMFARCLASRLKRGLNDND
jgi:hypothetical protein